MKRWQKKFSIAQNKRAQYLDSMGSFDTSGLRIDAKKFIKENKTRLIDIVSSYLYMWGSPIDCALFQTLICTRGVRFII